jgi:hypothetical protein
MLEVTALDRNRRNPPGLVVVAVAGTIIASTMLIGRMAAAVPRYDGLWSVSVITEKGDCDRGYRYPIRISNGTLANAGDTTFSISGKVGGTGAVNVTISGGGRTANGSGRLAGNAGNGSWTGGSCSGSWTAERRGS